MAKIIGGVVVTGFISPSDTGDSYAVIDPIYGIDGLRNFSGDISILDSIPAQRRRAGMIVGVNNGSQMYQLKPSPWTNTISDWTQVSFTGGNDPNALHKTGDEIFTGMKSSTINGTDAMQFHNLGGGSGIYFDNTSVGNGMYTDNRSTGHGIGITNYLGGDGIRVDNIGTGNAIELNSPNGGLNILATNSSPNDNSHFINDVNAGLNSAAVYAEVNTNTVSNYCFQAGIAGTKGSGLSCWTATGTDELITTYHDGAQTTAHAPNVRIGHVNGVGLQIETGGAYNQDNIFVYRLNVSTGNVFRYQLEGTDKVWLNKAGEWTAQKFVTAGGTNTQVVLGDGTLGTYSTGGGGIPYLEHNDAQKTVWDNGFNNISSNLTYGEFALANTTGTQNTGIGISALFSLTTGGNNTGVGLSALASITTQSSNTAIGASTLNQVIGASNTSVGAFALTSLTSGNDNVAIGANAGQNQSGPPIAILTQSSNGIFIGSNTKPKANNSTNEIVIGYNGVGNGNNTVTIGNGTITNNYFFGNVNATADVIAFSSSDRRLKDNITKIENPLEKISKLNGYMFDWNDKQDTYTGHDVGVIAQEVEEILPEVVMTREDGYKAVKYEKLIPLLIESINALQEEVKQLKAKLNG